MRSSQRSLPAVANQECSQLSHSNTHTSAVKKLEQCPFCDSKLLFTHDLNLSYLQVVESSRCPGCGVTMKPKTYTLQ